MPCEKYGDLPFGIRDSRADSKARQAQKRESLEDPAYLKRVRELPCCICGRKPSDPHHWPRKRKNGRNWHDHKTIPLCRGCHTVKPDSFHRLVGSLRTWENHHGVSIAALIERTQKTLGIA